MSIFSKVSPQVRDDLFTLLQIYFAVAIGRIIMGLAFPDRSWSALLIFAGLLLPFMVVRRVFLQRKSPRP